MKLSNFSKPLVALTCSKFHVDACSFRFATAGIFLGEIVKKVKRKKKEEREREICRKRDGAATRVEKSFFARYPGFPVAEN